MTERPASLPSAPAWAEDCSALLDGAANEATTDRLLRRFEREPQLRLRFARYALISSALKGQLGDLGLHDGFADFVQSRLPVATADKQRRSARLLSWALAGGLAVAVFATLVLRRTVTLPPLFRPVGLKVATAAPPRPVRLLSYGNPARVSWRRGAPAEQRVLDEYLLTHLSAPGYAPIMIHARLAAYEVMLTGSGRGPARP